jgi:hypothetical protein
VPLVQQELLTIPEHLSSSPVFSRVRVTRSLVLYVYFVDRCLSFCTFFTPVSRRAVLFNGYGGRRPAGGSLHRFPHNNFSSIYWIFNKLGHIIPLWKGKNTICYGVIRSKVKVTVIMNIMFDNIIVSTS